MRRRRHPDLTVRGGSAWDRWDSALLSRLHRREPRHWDTAFARLSTAADHSKLWMGAAALLATTGKQNRGAAVRGLAGLGVASALANGPAKLWIRRPRPAYGELAAAWLPRRLPITSSFPSGHSASAAAFATGVALESPKLAVPVGALAAAVAYSRVNTGVHYPGDVVAGIALGVTAAVLVRALWRSAPAAEKPGPVAEPVDLPRLGEGAGLGVVLNTRAGDGESDDLEQAVREAFPAAEIRRVGEHEELAEVLAKAAAGAVALGAAGGDGTINAAADAALAADIPLLVLPSGTLNHFARALRAPTVADALDAARTSSGVLVDVAAVAVLTGDRRVFVNNSSIGVYPELVALRERLEDHIGKWPAAALALGLVLARSQPIAVNVAGRDRRVWLLFAGNCRYTQQGLRPLSRKRLDDGLLDIRLLDADRRWSRTRLVAAIVTRRIDRCWALETLTVTRLRVLADTEPVSVARDGERDDPVAGFDWIKAGRLRVFAPTD